MPVRITDLDTGELALARPHATLVEVAADKLRELILLEKLPAGAHISERDLAAALGISRTPLTRALTILEQDGLIEYSVTRRPQVANPPLEEITQNLVVNARAAGPRLGKEVQHAIKGSKSGDWSVADDGTVTAGGIALVEGEYSLETVAGTADDDDTDI